MRTVVIYNIHTEQVVKTFDVSDKSDRYVEKLISGIGINLNWDEFDVEERKS